MQITRNVLASTLICVATLGVCAPGAEIDNLEATRWNFAYVAAARFELGAPQPGARARHSARPELSYAELQF